MMPADDPTWPLCLQSSCVGGAGGARWCEHIRKDLIEAKDAGSISTGIRICVPIVPKCNEYAEVAIDSEELIPGVAKIFLVRSLPFEQNEELISLGLLSADDGRMAISSVIQDWIRAQSTEHGDLPCGSKGHGFAEVNYLLSRISKSEFLKANNWKIASTGMCIPCFNKYEVNNQTNNYGLGGIVSNNPLSAPIAPLTSITPPSQQSIRSKLKNRFA